VERGIARRRVCRTRYCAASVRVSMGTIPCGAPPGMTSRRSAPQPPSRPSRRLKVAGTPEQDKRTTPPKGGEPERRRDERRTLRQAGEPENRVPATAAAARLHGVSNAPRFEWGISPLADSVDMTWVELWSPGSPRTVTATDSGHGNRARCRPRTRPTLRIATRCAKTGTGALLPDEVLRNARGGASHR
jgi:hypothetical protein